MRLLPTPPMGLSSVQQWRWGPGIGCRGGREGHRAEVPPQRATLGNTGKAARVPGNSQSSKSCSIGFTTTQLAPTSEAPTAAASPGRAARAPRTAPIYPPLALHQHARCKMGPNVVPRTDSGHLPQPAAQPAKQQRVNPKVSGRRL